MATRHAELIKKYMADRPKQERCAECHHAKRCRNLLGPSFNPDGPCDWVPSRWKSQDK